MIVIVQEVLIRWQKGERSGDGPRARAALPRRYPLPGLPPLPLPNEAGKVLTLLRHRVTLDAAEGYAVSEELEASREAAGSRFTIPGFTLRLDTERATMTFAWEWAVGAPERSTHPRQVVAVSPGEWGTAAWNGRYTTLQGLDGWKYHELTLNVAMLDPSTRLQSGFDPFSGEPRKRFSSLEDLR